MGAAHPTPPACLCTSAPSPCPSPDTGVCAVPGVQGGGPPARSDGGPCLESRRLLLVTSSTVSTATLKAYSCCLANEPALAAVLGDTEPRPPAHHPDLGPQQPLPPPMNPQITSPRQCLDSPAAPPSAPRPPKATDPLHPAGRAPRPRPCPGGREELAVTYKRQADGLINFLLPQAVIRWNKTSPETVNWANYSSFRF